MIRILILLAACLASAIADAQVPSGQPFNAENARNNSNLSATIRRPPHFPPRYLPPVNTMQQISVAQPHKFYASFQTPVITRGQAFPGSHTANTNANFSRIVQGISPAGTVHFLPNNRASFTPNARASGVPAIPVTPGVPAIPAIGIPSTPVMAAERQQGTGKITAMNAGETAEPTMPTERDETTLLKDLSSHVVDTKVASGLRPGFCPVRQCSAQLLTQTIRVCYADVNCLATEKCCKDPCWNLNTCAFAIPHSSALVCPPQTSCSDQTIKLKCQSDLDCATYLESKCCMDLCLAMYVCKLPVLSPTVNPGPWVPPVVPPTGSPPPKCKQYCPGTKDCCDGVTEVEHAGFCPAPSLCDASAQAAAQSDNFTPCAIDEQCAASQKCCPSRCHDRMECLPYVSNAEYHPGSCPATSKCNLNEERRLAECTHDRHCYISQRCCRSLCYSGKRLCKTSSTNTTQPDSTCTTFCPGSKFCCDNETKSGYCPKSALCPGGSISNKVCTSDYNCLDNMKCCYNQCSGQHHCTPPADNPDEHAGFCPALNCSSAVAPIAPLRQCEADSDCYMGQKCCKDCSKNNRCERALPVEQCSFLCPGTKECCDGKEKEDHCPAKAVCGSGSPGPNKTCNQDYECPDTQKCCDDECLQKKICHLPASHAETHHGSCPKASAADPRKFICHRDADCFINERCCPTAGNDNQCQKIVTTLRFTAYNVRLDNAGQASQARPLQSNLNIPAQYLAPPSTHAGIPSSNKYSPLSIPAPHQLPMTGYGPNLHPMTNAGGPQNLHRPLPPRQPSPGSTYYPAAPQPFSNRYTLPVSHGYRPQTSFPQTSESLLSSSGRHVAPRFKQRPKYNRPAHLSQTIPNI